MSAEFRPTVCAHCDAAFAKDQPFFRGAVLTESGFALFYVCAGCRGLLEWDTEAQKALMTATRQRIGLVLEDVGGHA